MLARNLQAIFFALLASACSQSNPQQTPVMNPSEIQISPIRHDELSPALLARIRATTDTFEIIDGISYEKAVDLYKRDLNPEENIVLWEEMVRAYKTFCRDRCDSPEERMDVYRTLLLRSMYSDEDTLARSQLKVLTAAEAKDVMKLYELPPTPVTVIKAP